MWGFLLLFIKQGRITQRPINSFCSEKYPMTRDMSVNETYQYKCWGDSTVNFHYHLFRHI